MELDSNLSSVQRELNKPRAPAVDVISLLVETSYLRKVGFGDPDFRKLLHYSKESAVKIFVPHIVWEERRTQLVEKVCNKLRKLVNEFEDLNALLSDNFLFEGLSSPSLTVWTEADVEAWSKACMAKFAEENKIEIVALAPDHAERAWQRYFDAQPPFNRDEKRENRRKDIPDAWIFEAAVDTKARYPRVLALCDDGRLSDALRSIEIPVFTKTQEVIDIIEKSVVAAKDNSAAKVEITLTDAGLEATVEVDGLQAALVDARAPFENLDKKIAGYVGYLRSPTKTQLFDLLSRSGIAAEMVKNVAERLAIAGIIKDTGNYYLPANKKACEQAAALIEDEIIKLLQN